jgi:hypothetical protein
MRVRKVAGSNPVAPTTTPGSIHHLQHGRTKLPAIATSAWINAARKAAHSTRHCGVVDVRSLPWQFEPCKAVAALGEISPMANCCTTRGHYSGSSTTRHRDLRASNVVTLNASIKRLCPHPILFQRTTQSGLRTVRQVGRNDATEHHGSTSATGSLRYGAAPFLPLETAGGRVG